MQIKNNLFIILSVLIFIISSCLNMALANKLPSLTSDKPIKMTGQLSKENFQIGDPFTYTVKLYQLEGIKANLKKLTEKDFSNLQLNDIKEKTELVKQNDKNIKITEYTYGLQIIDLENVTIPEIKVKSSKVISTLKEKKLKPQKAIDENNPIKDIHDIKDLEPYQSFDYWYIVLVLIALVILVAAGILIYFLIKRFLKHKAIVKEEDLRSAHEIAYEQLDMLKKTDPNNYKECKLYYTELSEILKNYLERRFNISALEKTTEEIGYKLTKLSINAKTRNIAKQILQDSDLVKFAKYLPSKEMIKSDISKTYQFVDITKIELETITNHGVIENV